MYFLKKRKQKKKMVKIRNFFFTVKARLITVTLYSGKCKNTKERTVYFMNV